jgi:HSP20 family molecular chaperone IbpA
MVYVSTLDKLLKDLFFGVDFESKPPCEVQRELDSSGVLRSAIIQYALAGFKEEDIKVYHENNVLYISGDNLYQKDKVASKFRSRFSYEIPVSRQLDLSEAEVSFENGLLSISIPVSKDKPSRQYLFGK